MILSSHHPQNTLASLRGSIERLEAHGGSYSPRRVALGHAEVDSILQGGLALGAMHEVFAEAGRQSGAATGFVAGLAGRAAARRPLVWVRQDFTEIESGALSMSNLCATVMAPLAGGSWNGNVMSASSENRRRILSLWLPRLPIDRIKRQLARDNAAPARAFSSELGTGSREESAAKQNFPSQNLPCQNLPCIVV